jgi:hypothetical protein
MPLTFKERCELEFSNYVENSFELAALLPNADNFFMAPRLQLPHSGGEFVAGHEPRSLRRLVLNALCARARFDETAPNWAPALPLREEAIAILANNNDPKLTAVGLFAMSQRLAGWHESHPSFHRYVRGVMAHQKTPDKIRHDADLRRDYPPHRLLELDETLCWRSDEKIAFDRLSAASHASDYL